MPRRWCRFVLLGVIGVSGVGCVSSEKPPPPLGLTPGLQSKLGAKADASAPPSSFDPSATGGKGAPAADAFSRPKPAGSGMGVSLPPPQLGTNTATPMVAAPVQPGVSVAPPSADTARMSRPAPRAVEAIQPASATSPLPPPGNALPPPKSDLTQTEPPVTRANYPQPSAPPAVNLSVPMTDPDPMPRPVPPPPPAAAPIAPDGPAPLSPLKPATDGPLPGGPLAPIEPLKPLK